MDEQNTPNTFKKLLKSNSLLQAVHYGHLGKVKRFMKQAYELGRKSSLKELSAALNETGAEEVIVNAFNLGRGVGREERDAELAAEFMSGSYLRDSSAVVDISQVVDNPAGEPWMEGD